MSFELKQLVGLPSPFYRVALKALVIDDNKRLLVVQTPDGLWEMPGGGWEFGEDIELCLKREFEEELGTSDIMPGDIKFIYRARSERGYQQLRIVVGVSLATAEFTHGSDMRAARFVGRDELMGLPMSLDEAPIKDYKAMIWPEKAVA